MPGDARPAGRGLGPAAGPGDHRPGHSRPCRPRLGDAAGAGAGHRGWHGSRVGPRTSRRGRARSSSAAPARASASAPSSRAASSWTAAAAPTARRRRSSRGWPFPDAWRLLLIFDLDGEGLHGAGEDSAFRQLPPYTPELAGRLCRLVVMRLLPGLADGRPRRRGPGHRRDPARGRRLFRPGPERPLHQPGGRARCWRGWRRRASRASARAPGGRPGSPSCPTRTAPARCAARRERRFGTGYESLRFMVTRARNAGAEISVGLTRAAWQSAARGAIGGRAHPGGRHDRAQDHPALRHAA